MMTSQDYLDKINTGYIRGDAEKAQIFALMAIAAALKEVAEAIKGSRNFRADMR